MRTNLPTANLLIGILVALIVFTGGFLMHANIIVAVIAALVGMFIIFTAKHLGYPVEKTSHKS